MKSFLAMALFAVVASRAFAGDSSESAVIVSATRFPEDAPDAPVGIRLISAREIARSNARTLPDLLAGLAGIHVRDSSGSPDQQLDLRGFGITGDQNTLVLLDGVRLNENDLGTTKLSAIPLQSIERIEILPGGGAVLYGGGATGGTINIVTKTPARRKGAGMAYVSYGTYASADVRAGFDHAEEPLGLALNASHQESNGYRANNGFRQDSVVGDVRHGADASRAAVKFGFDTQHLQLPGVRSESQFQSDPRGATTPGDWSERLGGFATFVLARPIGDAAFAADLGYRSNDATAYFANFAPTAYSRIRTKSLVFSPRVRWPLTLQGIDGTLIAGADWSGWDYDRRFASSLGSFGAPDSSTSGTQVGRGAYLEYNGTLTPDTKLTLGGRLQRIADHRVSTGFFASDQSQTQQPHAGEVALQQRLEGRWFVRGRLGTSFRAANVDENGSTVSGDLLKVQTARHREGGVEYRDAGIRLGASLYRIDLENEIYFSPIAIPVGSSFPGANTNLSPTRREGVELAGRWAASGGVELSGTLIHQSAKFRSGIYGGIDVSGNDVPLVPRRLANVHLFFSLPEQTTLGVSGRYVGPQRYDNDQDNAFPRRMPAYALLDVKLGRESRAWRFSAAVNNLLDRKYFSYGVIDTFGTCGTPTCVYPQAGRTLFVSAERELR